MGAYAHIKKCFELSDEDLLTAVESREDTLALLRHLADIASPNTGAAKVLVVFARMGTVACEWFDGDLRVDIKSDGASCTIEVTAELGMGMRERICPSLVYGVPLEEFTRAVERVPDRIRPLTVRAQTAKLLSLGVTEEVRHTSMPPPPIKISDDSFFLRASLKAAKTPTIEGRAPQLPVVTSQPQSAHRASVRKILVAKATSKSSGPPKAKSIRPPPKSIRPPPKSVRPPPKSVRPPPKSIRPPPAKSARPAAPSKSIRAAKPILEKPPLPRPKPREANETNEKRTPPLPIVEPGLPLVMPDSKRMKAARPSRSPSKAPPKQGKLSLEARLADVEIDDAVDSGWEDE